MALTCPPVAMEDPIVDAAAPTFGVEEEFLLLWPDGAAAAVAPQVLGALPGDVDVHPEWMQYQVETVTGVCTDLSALGAEMSAGRRAVAQVASTWGARVVAVGTPPFGVPGLSALTDDARYRVQRERFPEVAAEVVTCGCHVHVGVPTRDLGVEVLNRVRGWLPVLLALSGNSPMWRGRDTGWQSYRYPMLTRWPSATLPPMCDSAAAYDSALAERITTGMAADAGGVYWFARLSSRYPTVEIRVADTGLTVADTMLHAALCRALVATALGEAVAGRPTVPVSETLLTGSLVNAARYGLGALLVDPSTGGLGTGRAVLDRLVEHVDQALVSAGDRGSVSVLLTERQRQRSGATRQRLLRSRSDQTAFVAALASASLRDHDRSPVSAPVPHQSLPDRCTGDGQHLTSMPVPTSTAKVRKLQ